MEIVTKKLSELKRPKRNVRLHTDTQLKEFRRSIEKFKQIRPIVIDENNVILAGNGLYEAMLSMGEKTAYCLIKAGLSENDKKKLMLADNRIFNLGVDDIDALDAIIAELGDDLDIPGFDDDLLRTITAEDKDVDEMMKEYGIVDDEDRKNEIKANSEETAEYIEETESKYEAPPAKEDISATTDETQEIKRFVICSKCGEKIWL